MLSKRSDKYKYHKVIITVVLTTGFILGISSCNHATDGSESKTITHSDVMVTQPIEKDVSTYEEFQGVTQFTQHLQIRAQSTGIISKSFISTGKNIETYQPLFIIKSREAAILNSSDQNDNILSKMADTVLSFSSGIIDQVLVQQGDFVQEGNILATSVSSASMRIVVSVPLEDNTSVFQNRPCKIMLPNGSSINGVIGGFLPIANNIDQTNQFLIYPESGQGLTENIHVRVLVKNKDIKNGIFVPKSSVYSNEELTRHWVLKVLHDSLAIEVPVITGIETGSLIEIINKSLLVTDNIIFAGGYGLPDSALVNVIQQGTYEKK
jgi:multidrug efflux pump subunit AcrA (membrane-fusion protein)